LKSVENVATSPHLLKLLVRLTTLTLLARTALTRPPPDTAKRAGVDKYGDVSTTASEPEGEDDDMDLPSHPLENHRSPPRCKAE